MPLDFFYTMVQKSQKWPKTQIKGGPALITMNHIHNAYMEGDKGGGGGSENEKERISDTREAMKVQQRKNELAGMEIEPMAFGLALALRALFSALVFVDFHCL